MGIIFNSCWLASLQMSCDCNYLIYSLLLKYFSLSFPGLALSENDLMVANGATAAARLSAEAFHEERDAVISLLSLILAHK